MKKIFLCIFLGIHSVFGMYVLHALKHNPLHCFNTRPSFGKTHFITGYQFFPHNKDNNADSAPKKIMQQSVASITCLDPERITQSFFTTMHDVRLILKELLDNAKSSILIAAFALTDNEIAKKLHKAHLSGIKVEIITDLTNMNERYSKTKLLVEKEIPIYYYNARLNTNPRQKNSPYARMHHKFLVIDNQIGVNGSTNLTKSGQKDNIENIMVFRDRTTVQEYIEEFERLKKTCERCAAHG